MEHNIPLITTLAAGFGIALVLGFLAERIKVPGMVVELCSCRRFRVRALKLADRFFA